MASPQAFVLFTGPMLMGTVFNWALLGVLTVQLYIFHTTFPHERPGIKALVYILYVLDLVQTAAATNFAWFMLVAGWGDVKVFSQVPWPGVAQPIVTGIISSIAQIYFAWRVWVLKPRSVVFRSIAVLIVLLALMQGSSAMVNGIKISLAADVSAIASLTVTVNLWLGGSFAVDILIAGTMIFILVAARRQSASKRTDALLKRLIVSTVETGAVTAVTAGADLFLFLANKANYLHLCPSLLLGKLYSIVVVASLNGRTRPGPLNNTTVHTSDLSSVTESHQLAYRGKQTGPPVISSDRDRTLIHVSTDIKNHSDNETLSISAGKQWPIGDGR